MNTSKEAKYNVHADGERETSETKECTKGHADDLPLP